MASAFWCIIKIPLPDFRAAWKDPLPKIYENAALSETPSLPPVPNFQNSLMRLDAKPPTLLQSTNHDCTHWAPELSLRSRPAQVSLRLLEKLEKFTPHHVLSEGEKGMGFHFWKLLYYYGSSASSTRKSPWSVVWE